MVIRANGRIIHVGNSGIERVGVRLGVGEEEGLRIDEGDGVGVSDGLGEGVNVGARVGVCIGVGLSCNG